MARKAKDDVTVPSPTSPASARRCSQNYRIPAGHLTSPVVIKASRPGSQSKSKSPQDCSCGACFTVRVSSWPSKSSADMKALQPVFASLPVRPAPNLSGNLSSCLLGRSRRSDCIVRQRWPAAGVALKFYATCAKGRMKCSFLK